MITVYKPAREEWIGLTKRPIITTESLNESIGTVLKQVKERGDQAIQNYASLFDGVQLTDFRVSRQEIEEAATLVNQDIKDAIAIAASNIRTFHQSQLSTEDKVETTEGVTCWRKSVGIEKVGLYIPGGTAPLFSTLLMLTIPAQLAGCKELVLCTPCNKQGKVNEVVLYAAQYLGIETIFKIGGAQAIAAMAYGTETVPQVYKIFGPGNQYVTKAKELVQAQGIAIDMPAGPSEVLVVADQEADADYIAADLLSQAEHGTDSQVVFVTTTKQKISEVAEALEKQLEELPRRDLAKQTLNNSLMIELSTIEECIAFSNAYAPEHLILNIENAEKYIDLVINAGSVFLGAYSCESAGDYASGTNHTLPTNGYAKSYSGVSVDSFVKKVTFQKLTKQGLKNIGKTIEVMAEAEELIAHKNAVSIRLKKLSNE
ncbi:histidinol dehydrogenase [Myroides odoratimimus CCUG 12901]|uniref:Histidinol dehydrogenase n=1 Tax=Myroides odoratimimus CCUG 10230 TaxID=883150 RepID=A0ABN0EAG4_9FLAO|nr:MULTISPECIES: histidinol dehydrogenase [Myroides]EHO07514.1 histidinol dehydrogenase [Myroides odoratimimus CCUG 12901]EHO09421.1 histidinol dehydrogenase [Myroides odoratimimus CCUG 10230]MCS7472377.1 histidinol dehydrogenase [Myroides odoratimimus]MDM1084917.1 histidinol dehydrogenase [Myroides odoratimimus]MDM1457769.1 histidinol dehydrogenase [Myroides odoratimimus]